MDKKLKEYFHNFSENKTQEILNYLIKKYGYEIQYVNEKNYRNIIKLCYEVLNSINKHKDKKILDFGCGINGFDYFNKLFFDYNLDSCDWEDRDEIYNIFCLNPPNYFCSDWTKDNFKIYNCEKKYDIIIIMRSILLHNNTFDNFIKLMQKLLPYLESTGYFILLQSNVDFKGETREFLTKYNKQFFNIKNNNGDIFVLEPSSIQTFID